MKPLSRDLKGSQFFGVNLMHQIKPLNLITGEEKKLHWARKWEPESIRMSDTVTGTHIFCIWILCRVVCGSEEEKGGGAAAHLLRIIWWWTGIRRMCVHEGWNEKESILFKWYSEFRCCSSGGRKDERMERVAEEAYNMWRGARWLFFIYSVTFTVTCNW